VLRRALQGVWESPELRKSGLTELRPAVVGAVEGTPGVDTIAAMIVPDTAARTYPDLDTAVPALVAGEVDALAVDLTTAFELRDDQLADAGTVVGQLPVTGGQGSYVMVLQKSSPATPCVDRALGVLRDNGTLSSLYDKWLVDAAGVPVLGP
jgi:polar amino acid transport system substrate-binding protein